RSTKPFDPFLEGTRSWEVNTALNKSEFYLNDGRAGSKLVNAYIDKVMVVVSKAYSGSDTSATLTLSNAGMGGAATYMALNVKEVGSREVTLFGTNGSQTGDTLTQLAQGSWCERIAYDLKGDGGTGTFTDGDDADLPEVMIVVSGVTPTSQVQS
ncbi:MAG: hypothetical protein ACR2RE_00695, partial [Geminicoccaceae bacterium]